MTSIHKLFILRNSQYKYDKCLAKCKKMNIDFKLFLMAVVHPKVDNSKNIYNLIDDFYKRTGDTRTEGNELFKLTSFIYHLKIKNAIYTTFWMETVLESIIDFDMYCGDKTMLREDFHCLYGDDFYDSNKYDATDKFLFVMQKYGYEKCMMMCDRWNDNHDDWYFAMTRNIPVYEYFGLRECVDFLPKAVQAVESRQSFLNDLSLHFVIFDGRHTKNMLGWLYSEMQKRKCDGYVERAFADEYIMAIICGYFSMGKNDGQQTKSFL